MRRLCHRRLADAPDLAPRVLEAVDCRPTAQRVGTLALVLHHGAGGYGWRTLAAATWDSDGTPRRAADLLASSGLAAGEVLLAWLQQARRQGLPWTRPGFPLVPGPAGRVLSYQALHASSRSAVAFALTGARGRLCG